MPIDNNTRGSRGEWAVATCLLRPLGDSDTVQFRPLFLGEKTELLDFLVLLVNKDDQALGPHFFLQVKATAGKTEDDDPSIAAKFSAEEVERVKNWKVPTYVAAVDLSRPERELIHIRGISSSRTKGIASVKKALSLDDRNVRKNIYKEVHEYFASREHNFITYTEKEVGND